MCFDAMDSFHIKKEKMMQKDCIKWNNIPIEYEWKASNRKSISISISKEGKISVRVPLGMPLSKIRECVSNKASWIIANQAEIREKNKKAPKREFQNGEALLFLGKSYRLCIRQDSSIGKETEARIRLLESTGELELSCQNLNWTMEEKKEVLEQWYRQEARKYLTTRVEYFKTKIPCTVGRIFIKNQKTCWGSCSTKGNLNFNWKIMMAPPEIVDYLVVHELCHRLEMNHSENFWNLVRKQIPDYQVCRKWLKENGIFLSW